MRVCVKGLKKSESYPEIFHGFLSYLQSELPLSKDIEIVLTSKRVGDMTTGIREPNRIKVLSKGRMLIDILRTVAHEWAHEYQHQKMNVPDDEPIPKIGGPIENMASVLSSIYLKKFQKEYPHFTKKIYTESKIKKLFI